MGSWGGLGVRSWPGSRSAPWLRGGWRLREVCRRRAAAPTPTGWAALGDSYTSGPLIPNQTVDPLGCLRSDHNYPHLAAVALGYSLSDISCSGAKVANLTQPQSTDLGTNPPQLSVVNTGDRVVTLGIGGNDIGFVSIIENCEALTPWGPTKVGLTCKAHYDAGGQDTIAAEIAALQPEVQAELVEIHTLAPHAQVFVVGYPAIMPPTGSGCWPQMPLTTTDVPYLRAKELQLNSMLGGGSGSRASHLRRHLHLERGAQCVHRGVDQVGGTAGTGLRCLPGASECRRRTRHGGRRRASCHRRWGLGGPGRRFQWRDLAVEGQEAEPLASREHRDRRGHLAELATGKEVGDFQEQTPGPLR